MYWSNRSATRRPASAPPATVRSRVNTTTDGSARRRSPNHTPPAYRSAAIAASVARTPEIENPSAALIPANTSTTPPARSTVEPTRAVLMEKRGPSYVERSKKPAQPLALVLNLAQPTAAFRVHGHLSPL